MRLGLCGKCERPASARYEIRNNKVYLVKYCRECGRSSTLVTKDARKWRWKREISEYSEPAVSGCSMDCGSCNHHEVTPPYTVAIDVTNLCNLRCPICLAYVDAMGYTYKPPIEYFDKIFRHFQDADPRPNICFFGGEPTVHPDFPEILALAKSYGFQAQLFTNGLKLADKDYCRSLCSQGIQVNFGFDGTTPEVYRTLRGRDILELKKKAFRNVVECGVNKLAVITTVAEGVNDSNLVDILDFIHEHRDHVSVWAFVPLTPCWEPGNVDLEPTTTECAENMLERLMPEVEFVPTGMMKFDTLSRFFGRQTLGGSHPNCESAMVMVSDGAGYRPLSTYLHVSLSEFLMKLRKLDRELTIESRTLPASGLSRKRFNVKVSLRTMAVLRDSLNLKAIFGESPWRGVLKALWDLGSGRTLDETLRTRTAFRHVLTVMTIPYEDKGGLEDARLKDCPAVFAYEDVETGEIRTTAFCSWQMVKDAVCKNIQEHYHGKEEPAAMAEIG